MSVALGIATLFLAAGPAQTVEQVDVAVEHLLAGEDERAIRTINSNDALAADDPARLINLGIAHARRGDIHAARAAFKAVLADDERHSMETADGQWVDSRVLARQGLAMLEAGQLTSNTRMANR